MREFSSLLALIFGFGLGACGGPSGSVTPASPASSSAPIPPPHPSITGCVESRELKAYVLALESHRKKARREALEALGAIDEERSGRFGAPGESDRSGGTFEANGQRFAIAQHLATGFEPRTTLAKQSAQEGALLRPIAERPRAHPVSVLSCGVQRCESKASAPCPPASAEPCRDANPRSPVRPLIIELGANETWGAPLELAYEYWWAKVSYDRAEPCDSSAAATATP